MVKKKSSKGETRKSYEIKVADEIVASNRGRSKGILHKSQRVEPVRMKKDELVAPALLINSNNKPEYVKYEGKGEIRLSPRQKSKVADHSKLGDLPKGVRLVKLKK